MVDTRVDRYVLKKLPLKKMKERRWWYIAATSNTQANNAYMVPIPTIKCNWQLNLQVLCTQ